MHPEKFFSEKVNTNKRAREFTFLLDGEYCELSGNYNKREPIEPPIRFGGEAGIRTLGPPKGSTDFESAPFDHSGTSPRAA